MPAHADARHRQSACMIARRRATERGNAGPDGSHDQRRRQRRRGQPRHAGAVVLHRDAEELGHALDQSRPDGVRPAQRLHRHRHRHGPRRRGLQHGAVRRHPVRRRLGPAGLLAGQQRPLPADGRPGREPGRPGGAGGLDAVVAHAGIPAAGHRRRDDHPRRGAGVLHRRHQPRDVPLHDDEPHVQGHGAGARRARCRRIASART